MIKARLAKQRDLRSLSSDEVLSELGVRLWEGSDADWQDRNFFYGFAKRVVDNMLVDLRRRKQRESELLKGRLPRLPPAERRRRLE
jgi:hypothetical protein